jgi:hypothetical protein
MQPIVYDVAVSIDGFIAGPDSDISRFAEGGRWWRTTSHGSAPMRWPSWAGGPTSSATASA